MQTTENHYDFYICQTPKNTYISCNVTVKDIDRELIRTRDWPK